MHHTAIMAWNANMNPTLHQNYDTETDAGNHVEKHANEYPEAFVALGEVVNISYTIVDPVSKTITVDTSAFDADTLLNEKIRVKKSIDSALSKRLNQGIRWAWSSGSTEYAVPLNSTNREFLTALKIDLADGELNPHDGYLQFNGVKLLAPAEAPLPDAAVIEICKFCSLWGQKISRIALAQKSYIGDPARDLATVQDYDATTINWSVNWDGHADWADDLVLKNP